MERRSGGCDYWAIASSSYKTSNLWGFLSQLQSNTDVLIAMAKESDMNGCLNMFHIFTVESNVYIGCVCNKFTPEKCILLKDDTRYFFKTTKQGFINLAHQWVKIYEQGPPGISIEEVSSDEWQVESMTKQDIEHYKELADRKTGLILGGTARNEKNDASIQQ